MNYQVLVMAGGSKMDWAPNGYRQLLTIDNIPLIDRIAVQAEDVFKTDPIIITDDYTKPFGINYRYFIPGASRTSTESLSYTEKIWGETTIILQGDVYYPDVSMEFIYRNDHFAFGRGCELYALKFGRDQQKQVVDAIKTAEKDKIGRLWCVYRAYEGYDISKNILGPSFYTFKDADSPIDFDKMERYNNFVLTRRAVNGY